MEVHTWIFVILRSSTRALFVAVKTPVVEQRNVSIKASIETQASTVHGRPLPLRSASRDAAHKCENVNYSSYTATISAVPVQDQHF